MTKRKKIDPTQWMAVWLLLWMLGVYATPDSLVWKAPFILLGLAGMGWQLRWAVTGGKSKRERRLEASRRRTAALEKDLGYKPLDLHELDGILSED
jgi:hypothetical protein